MNGAATREELSVKSSEFDEVRELCSREIGCGK
jgi:hypothetical protein|eukprot:COSAG06_NODE_3979_length_4692_cov_5.523841_5_plen_33_part_00